MSNLETFDKLKADITLFVEPCKSITISSKDTCDSALKTGKEVKEWIKKVEEKRKELVGPLNEQVKKINAYAAQISEPLEGAETHIKLQLKSWEEVLKKEREEAARKLEEERKKAEEEARKQAEIDKEEAATAAMFMSDKDAKRAEIVNEVKSDRELKEINTQFKKETKAITENKVSGAKQVWTFTITDENLVPREFLMIDEKKIREAIRLGKREIAGVNIYQETKIAL